MAPLVWYLEHGYPRSHAIHFHVDSSECNFIFLHISSLVTVVLFQFRWMGEGSFGRSGAFGEAWEAWEA